MEQNAKQTSSIPKKPKNGKGETVAELVHRHLMDENHVTTDEELRNVQIELHNEAPSEVADEEETKSESTEKESPLANSNDVVVTPWDTIK